ncbi:MAG: hypothetical protein ACRDTM_05505 [Micromonosporaceae bacterium]
MSDIALVVVARPGTDPQRLEAATRELRRDLAKLAGVRAAAPTTPLPDGAKSGTLTLIGTLVLSAVFSAQTVDAIARVVVAHIQARTDWSVTLERGDVKVSLSGRVPEAELERAVQALAAIGDPPPGTGQSHPEATSQGDAAAAGPGDAADSSE